MIDLFIFCLKFKVNVCVLRYGFFWVYVNEVVIDWCIKSFMSGFLVVFEDGEWCVLGLVMVNFNSKIIGCVLDCDFEVVIDKVWFVVWIVKVLDM